MLRFKTLEIKNFLSIKEASINFDNSFQIIGYNKDEGGSNGSGKSAIIEALFFVLYGESLRQIPIKGLIRLGSKGAKVKLVFIKDDIEYSLTRWLKPGSDALLSFQAKQIKGVKNVNSFLENILPDKNLFYLSSLFSNKTKFSNLTDKEKKNLVATFVNLDVIDHIREKVADDKATYEQAIYRKDIKLGNYKGRIKEIKQQWEKLNSYINTFKLDEVKYKKCKKIVDKGLPKRKAMKDYSYQIRYLQNEIKKLEQGKNSLKQKVCPTCLRPFTDEKLLQKRKSEFDKQIKELREKLDKIIKLAESQKKEDDNYIKRLKTFMSCRDYVKDYNNYLNTKRDLKDIEKRIKEIKSEYKTIKKEKEHFEELRQITDFWLKSLGWKGVKYDLIKNFLNIFSNLVNSYVSKLDLPFFVVFESKGENFERLIVNIKTPNGIRPLESFSTGEKRKIDIAFMLALNDIAFKMGIGIPYLIFDEVLDGLDVFSIEKVVNLLKQSSKYFIIVSHIPLRFDIDKIVIVKENGISLLQKE